MHTHLLQREQFVPRPIDEVFSFFCDASNLEAITPPWFHLEIVSKQPIEMRSGTLIEYRLRWRGIRMGWTSEITDWEPPHRFVDVQLRGPYAAWRHTHEFVAVEQGTVLRDRVEYAMPLGLIGRLVHRLSVRRNLEAIFDYRAQSVAQLLGA